MQYSVGVQNPKTGAHEITIVTLTPEQQAMADGPRAPRSCIINGFVAMAANHVVPGFQWDGDLSAIRPVQ
jgi:hypothetical protein